MSFSVDWSPFTDLDKAKVRALVKIGRPLAEQVSEMSGREGGRGLIKQALKDADLVAQKAGARKGLPLLALKVRGMVELYPRAESLTLAQAEPLTRAFISVQNGAKFKLSKRATDAMFCVLVGKVLDGEIPVGEIGKAVDALLGIVKTEVDKAQKVAEWLLDQKAEEDRAEAVATYLGSDPHGAACVALEFARFLPPPNFGQALRDNPESVLAGLDRDGLSGLLELIAGKLGFQVEIPEEETEETGVRGVVHEETGEPVES